ncbi:TPA: HIT family hydrolase [bacterium]|nr:HIT family hydrolase [bacterium]
MERGNLFIPGKLPYARGKRPEVDCILCAIRDKDERVKNLVVYEVERFIVTLNLYPYAPGHLMIFPKSHLLDLREINQEDLKELHRLTTLSLDVLDHLYQPHGYNLGYNVGVVSGASMEHLHLHIVPRYRNEMGFLDIINGARIIVEDPVETKDKLKEAFKQIAF